VSFAVQGTLATLLCSAFQSRSHTRQPTALSAPAVYRTRRQQEGPSDRAPRCWRRAGGGRGGPPTHRVVQHVVPAVGALLRLRDLQAKGVSSAGAMCTAFRSLCGVVQRESAHTTQCAGVHGLKSSLSPANRCWQAADVGAPLPHSTCRCMRPGRDHGPGRGQCPSSSRRHGRHQGPARAVRQAAARCV